MANKRGNSPVNIKLLSGETHDKGYLFPNFIPWNNLFIDEQEN
jgi:hypothetical protein